MEDACIAGTVAHFNALQIVDVNGTVRNTFVVSDQYAGNTSWWNTTVSGVNTILQTKESVGDVTYFKNVHLLNLVEAMTSAFKTSGSPRKLYSRSSRCSRPTPRTFRTFRI